MNIPVPAAGQIASPSTTDCSADELSYVCGLRRPEDLLALPDGRHLIASGFAAGAGLTFVDTTTRSITRAWTGRIAPSAPASGEFPDCTAPVDPTLFNARGLSLRQVADRWRLLVVNHGGRESIEVFDLLMARDGAPVLEWAGCLPMPQGQVGNSVASFADGTVLVTVLTRPGTSIADFVQGKVTGAVWRWRPGDHAFEAVPGTELPGNNGLEVDPDGRHFYVVAFGLHAVVVFDRTREGAAVETIAAPDFMPDNIHWSGGRLLLAGMRLDEPACGGLRRVIDGVADPMLCHRGWLVGELDLKQRRISTVAYGGPQPGFNGLSSAALVRGELWLGSFQSDRLAITRPPPSR